MYMDIVVMYMYVDLEYLSHCLHISHVDKSFREQIRS